MKITWFKKEKSPEGLFSYLRLTKAYILSALRKLPLSMVTLSSERVAAALNCKSPSADPISIVPLNCTAEGTDKSPPNPEQLSPCSSPLILITPPVPAPSGDPSMYDRVKVAPVGNEKPIRQEACEPRIDKAPSITYVRFFWSGRNNSELSVSVSPTTVWSAVVTACSTIVAPVLRGNTIAVDTTIARNASSVVRTVVRVNTIFFILNVMRRVSNADKLASTFSIIMTSAARI